MDITFKNVTPDENDFINALFHLEYARNFMNSEDCSREIELAIVDAMQIFSVKIRRLIE